MLAAHDAWRFLLEDYEQWWRWTCDHYPEFWKLVMQNSHIVMSSGYEKVIEEGAEIQSIPRWFPGCKLNYAENLLRNGQNDKTAIIQACIKLSLAPPIIIQPFFLLQTLPPNTSTTVMANCVETSLAYQPLCALSALPLAIISVPTCLIAMKQRWQCLQLRHWVPCGRQPLWTLAPRLFLTDLDKLVNS